MDNSNPDNPSRRQLIGRALLSAAALAALSRLPGTAFVGQAQAAPRVGGPARFNHLGIPVDDLQRAIRWYRDLFGFQLIAGPIPLVVDDSVFGQISIDFNGPDFPGGEFAHMVDPNGIGLELFFTHAVKDDQRLYRNGHDPHFWRFGPSHFCLTVDDVAATAARMTANGGKQRSKIWQLDPGKPDTFAYCEDPFGNIIELYNVNYQTMWMG